MIRAFIAIELDRAVLRRVASAVDTLRGKISAIRWTAEDSCHLTLKFLGNIN
jgi:2'-5' RNA ligase